MTANIITLSRVVFSLLLLAFPPDSGVFAALYILCGVSDVLDGFAARRLHTESEKGARLDSAADIVFALVYAARILPALPVPLWIWIWTAVIAAVKAAGIILASKKAHRFTVEHSFGNKLTGLLLFLLPLSARIADVRYAAAVVCLAATGTVIGEIIGIMKYKPKE